MMNTSPHPNEISLRVANKADEHQITNICLQTADSGKDASSLYSIPDLPAIIWATPYLHFDPSFCFVIEKDTKLLGYIVSAPNTEVFKRWQNDNWWPLVAQRLQGIVPKTKHDRLGWDAIANEKQAAPKFAERYPAHLHINLLPEAQGTGFGRKLIEAVCEKLQSSRISGVHLGVSKQNSNAIGFYKALGFKEIADNGAIFLGKTLPRA